MSRAHDPRILRNAVLHTAPRALTRDPAPAKANKVIETLPGGGHSIATVTHLTVPESGSDVRQRAHKEGHASGYEAGLQQGLAEAEQRIQATVKELRQRSERELQAIETRRRDEIQGLKSRMEVLLPELQSMTHKHLATLENQAAALAFTAVQKILGAPEDRGAHLRAVIHQHLQTLASATELRVRLSPADWSLFGPEAGALHSADLTGIELVRDASLRPGACHVESRTGQIDIGLETQLARLGDVWAQAAEAQPIPPISLPRPGHLG